MKTVLVALSTYGRAAHPGHCLEEAVHGILQQTYKAIRLVICNDTPGQELIFDDPRVTVINYPKRCWCLAEKRNRAARADDSPLILSADDDDILLPHAVEALVDALGDHQHAVIKGHWYSEGNEIKQYLPFARQNPSIMTRELFEAHGGYRIPLNQGHDADFAARIGPAYRQVEGKPFLLYRWGNNVYHLSGQKAADENDRAQYDAVGRQEAPPGRYVLSPHWERDYEKDAAAFGMPVKKGAP